MWTYMTCVPGAPGAPGRDGAKGDSGTPRLASYMNWKECTWTNNDDKDSGLIYVSKQNICVIRKNKQRIVITITDYYSPHMI